ncbi:CoA-binding protein [Thalassotalea ponticola]|uniref:CoA-binding protein n=1 Tax=Thalassotalea ponticola TaxID=1523392 RepID=UPI0025B59C5F|nr:CoA-binding protein [Thalassotalea ponticola]MDN3651964.1 CoA-binding protein [Thalassotalea ponticola]
MQSHIADTLFHVKHIALIGASDKADRASNQVMAFLQHQGYRVYPVNPLVAGKEIHNERVYACLADITAPIDMVDVFRQGDALPEIVEQCHQLGIKRIWTQLGVVHHGAEQQAEQYGIDMIVDRCPKIEIPKLQSIKLLADPVHQQPS